MSEILDNKKILLAKLETTYGVDAVPTGSDAVLCNSITVNPLKADVKERSSIKAFYGANAKVVTGMHASVDIEIDLAPGGDANGTPIPGTVPQWDPLLQACGFQRTITAVAINSTLQAGSTASTVKLNAGASGVDDIYAGMSLLMTSESGVAQAPDVAGNKKTVKLASSYNELSGTTGASPASTTTAVNLGASASAEDSYYVGMSLVIASETRTISDYNGTTKVATVSSAFSGAPASGTAYVVPHKADHFSNHSITVTHFATTAIRAGTTPTNTSLCVPANVSNDLVDLTITVIDGANTEIRTIKSSNQASNIVIFDKPLSFTPTSSATFNITETKRIKSFDGANRVATLESSLRFATVAGTAYSIGVNRLIIDYNGTTKVARITPAFENGFRPASGAAYKINPNIKYAPISGSQSSVTLYFYLDDVLHSFVGARGNASFDFSAGNLATAKISLLGLIDKYEGATVTGVNLEGFVLALPVNAENTKNIIIEGYEDAVLDKLSVDTGNVVAYRNKVNYEGIAITDRKGKGSITLQATRPDDFDFFAKMKTMSTSQIALTHGPLGNQISFFAPKGQLSNPQYSTSDGITMLQMDLDYLPQGDGNNEISLILQ